MAAHDYGEPELDHIRCPFGLALHRSLAQVTEQT